MMSSPKRQLDLHAELRNDEPDYDELARLGPAVFDEVRTLVEDKDLLLATKALKLLGQVDPDRAIPVLAEVATQHDDPANRATALHGLAGYVEHIAQAGLKPERAISLQVLEQMTSPMASRREQGNMRIALLQLAAAVQSDTDEAVRWVALSALDHMLKPHATALDRRRSARVLRRSRARTMSGSRNDAEPSRTEVDSDQLERFARIKVLTRRYLATTTASDEAKM